MSHYTCSCVVNSLHNCTYSVTSLGECNTQQQHDTIPQSVMVRYLLGSMVTSLDGEVVLRKHGVTLWVPGHKTVCLLPGTPIEPVTPIMCTSGEVSRVPQSGYPRPFTPGILQWMTKHKPPSIPSPNIGKLVKDRIHEPSQDTLQEDSDDIVGVMKDLKIKMMDLHTSYTLGGVGNCNT